MHAVSIERTRNQRKRCVVKPLIFLVAIASLCSSIGSRVYADELAQDSVSTQSTTGEQAFFEDRVAAIVQRSCLKCHNSDAKKGSLDLSSIAGLIRGGESGEVFVAGRADKSLLYESVHAHEMPPEGEPLAESEIETIRNWIEMGAKFRSPSGTAKQIGAHDVLPIFLLRCAACHGAELKRGGLDLTKIKSIKAGGKSGPALVPGQPNDSHLIQRIEKQLCPPTGQLLKYFVRRPTSPEIEKLRTWIESGAPEDVATKPETEHGDSLDLEKQFSEAQRTHWSFQPLPARVSVPRIAGRDDLTPIDAFVYREMVKHGLDFSPAANRHVLIRRVYFDLIGLPPTVTQQLRWETDFNPYWYSAMVDELLASPRYGERWGRYWLDVAGYADSEGGVAEDVVREVAWKYRDYVIRSFNADKPWDQFLMEQIAGDELADYTSPEKVTEQVVDNLIATGFLRMGIDQTGSRTMNFVPERLGVIADAINVVGTGVLGLTLECSRCHSHKYDPIPQADYYRFKAIMQGAFDEHDWMSWKTRKMDTATAEQIARQKNHNADIERRLKQLANDRTSAIKLRQDAFYNEAWPKIAADLQKEILAAVKETPDRRTLRQEDLVARYESEIRPPETVLVRTHPELASELGQLDAQIGELASQLLPPLEIRALWDRGRPSPTYLLVRGEHDRPGPQVFPGVPSVLAANHQPLSIQPPWPGARSTGRRLALARWLVDPRHPLTARVLVNRVWNQHFGQGIVKSLDNFGLVGAKPSHPELLDWLAGTLVQEGWSLKTLHRHILHSRTFRQTSSVTAEHQRIDPENVWLARMSLRRLEAEVIRDSILAVAGRLDIRMFGPPAQVDVREDGLIMDVPSPTGQFRRSLYLRMRRTEMPSMLATFDYPEMQPNCTQRTVSTVALQSLMLSNNAHVHQWSEDFASSIQQQIAGDHSVKTFEVGSSDQTISLDVVYRRALARAPTADELRDGRAALDELERIWREAGADAQLAKLRSLATLCHSILNSAEFIYID